MNCPNCGKKLPVGAKFCNDCGAPITAVTEQPIYQPPISPPPMYEPPQSMTQQPRTSGLAIASLVLGLLGLISMGITGIAGIITGAIALRQIKQSNGQIEGKGIAIAGILSGVATAFLMFIAIVAAIAIPNFLSAKGKAYQAEAQQNLSSIYTAEQVYYTDNGRYTATFKELNWKPMTNSHYAYFLSANESIQPEGKQYSLPADAQAFVEDSNLQIVAVSNIDSDATLDVWTVDQDKNIVNVSDDVKN